VEVVFGIVEDEVDAGVDGGVADFGVVRNGKAGGPQEICGVGGKGYGGLGRSEVRAVEIQSDAGAEDRAGRGEDDGVRNVQDVGRKLSTIGFEVGWQSEEGKREEA
jgi:hypothetical protein